MCINNTLSHVIRDKTDAVPVIENVIFKMMAPATYAHLQNPSRC